MKTLLIDNYDSFTYNLLQILEESTLTECRVCKNDEISLEAVASYDKILISPGPGLPEDVPLLKKIFQTYATKKSILGVCLGHQALGHSFGAELIHLDRVYHGIKEKIRHSGQDPLFRGIPEELEVGLYHSWALSAKDLPTDFQMIAKSQSGINMGLRYKNYPVWGLQFHPESVMSDWGRQILHNWLLQP